MHHSPTLSDALQPDTVCILSPVRVKEATFMKLGELQSRTIRLVHGDLPEAEQGHDYDETTYIAQLSLHLTHCDELIRLPLMTLEEDAISAFSFTLTVDLRQDSDLMMQIMPHFSRISIYHYDSVQCDINVFELIATADCQQMIKPAAQQESLDLLPSMTLPVSWPAPPVSTPSAPTMNQNGALTPRRDSDKTRRKESRSEAGTVSFAPLTPSKTLASKLSTSMRKMTGREKSGHKRTPSNNEMVYDTVGIDRSHWKPAPVPSSSYESCTSIDLGSYDD